MLLQVKRLRPAVGDLVFIFMNMPLWYGQYCPNVYARHKDFGEWRKYSPEKRIEIYEKVRAESGKQKKIKNEKSKISLGYRNSFELQWQVLIGRVFGFFKQANLS